MAGVSWLAGLSGWTVINLLRWKNFLLNLQETFECFMNTKRLADLEKKYFS